MQIRPELTPFLGKPTLEIHDLLTDRLKELSGLNREQLDKGTNPAQMIYIAAGLAEWDRHVGKKLSVQTKAALSLMLENQKESGTWSTVDCWPPLESSAFQEATVAAMAVAAAPGWRESVKDEKLKGRIGLLQKYLRETEPPNDYGSVVLLWAATRMPDLLKKERRKKKRNLMI